MDYNVVTPAVTYRSSQEVILMSLSVCIIVHYCILAC